jgi:hypothetical protein
VKVSIIIAVYNEAGTVGTLLERVWAQPLLRATKEPTRPSGMCGLNSCCAAWMSAHAKRASPRPH